jgi:hypothetical protein
MLLHQCASELDGIGLGGARDLVDEALHVDAVLVGVDAAPRPDRHVRVAHRIFDPQMRERVAELRIAGFLPPALELALVLAFLRGGGVHVRVDRLPGKAHVQSGDLAVGVEPGGELALRDRPIEVVRHVLFAAPDHLHRDAGKLLGDRHRLSHVVLRPAATSEPAAEHGPCRPRTAQAGAPIPPIAQRAKLRRSAWAPMLRHAPA